MSAELMNYHANTVESIKKFQNARFEEDERGRDSTYISQNEKHLIQCLKLHHRNILVELETNDAPWQDLEESRRDYDDAEEVEDQVFHDEDEERYEQVQEEEEEWEEEGEEGDGEEAEGSGASLPLHGQSHDNGRVGEKRKHQRRLPANVKRAHRGGLLIAVKQNGRTAKVKPTAFAPGKQMRGVCIHLVGGARGNCAMTKLRREQARTKHNATLGPDGVHCAHHVSNWKTIGNRSHSS